MNKAFQRFIYIIADFIAAALAWGIFYISRKILIEIPQYGVPSGLTLDYNFFFGLICIPLSWILLYFISGYYNSIFRKSRLNDIIQTFTLSIFGVLIVFFFFILDDYVQNYQNYYLSFLRLFCLHFFFTVFFRIVITFITNRRIRKGQLQFNTLLIGGDSLAVNTLQQIKNARYKSGNRFMGYAAPSRNASLDAKIEYLGTYDQIDTIITKKTVDEVVIAEGSGTENSLIAILDKLDYRNVIIKASAELYDDLKRITRVQPLYMTPLIGVMHESMPVWQQNVKQIIDFAVSLLVLIICSPLFLVIITGIKITSPGPVFFKQERIGQHGREFYLYKFRSMFVDAEKDGPRLTQRNDKRLTSSGRFLRRTKLDELPNFINVLKGDISIVGPRSERKYFIDQIVQKAPHYLRLLKIKPGITSLGQIKYGYASTVDEMIKRLRYDIIYLENMSLYQDLKVVFYTFLILFKGRGV